MHPFAPKWVQNGASLNCINLPLNGELLLPIMSSLDQEVSRSISENIRWGLLKKSATGKFSLNYSHFLGYDKGLDGGLLINFGQAAIVCRIFGEFLVGKSVSRIGKDLTAGGIPTPSGKTVWSTSTIRGILSNETYKGDKLLQKTYSTDSLDKTRRKKCRAGTAGVCERVL